MGRLTANSHGQLAKERMPAAIDGPATDEVATAIALIAMPRPRRDNARIVLTGSFCEQPPLSLIKSSPTPAEVEGQLEAATILEPLWKAHPNHPGLVHYLIHAYDYPTLAPKGLAAADYYATIAPWVFVANLPPLIRAGPEGYKGFLIEAVLIPVGVLVLACRPKKAARRTLTVPYAFETVRLDRDPLPQ